MQRIVRILVPLLMALASSTFVRSSLAQEPGTPPPGHPPIPSVSPSVSPSATAPATPPAAGSTQDPQRPAVPGSEQPAAAEGDAAATPNTAAAAKPPRRGIPVDDPLVHTHCARCHALDDKQHMTRVSFVRKSPEGWSETIKRMGRLYGLQLSPTDAKQVVRSLANSHGLARSEAERGLYESERRVHWSEDHHDQDFKRACAQCHPLGRVLLQQRDNEEWQLLRATHVAMFPLSRGQMGGGPPDDEPRRGGGGQGGGAGGGAPAGAGGASPGGTGGAAGGGGQGGRGRGGAGAGAGTPTTESPNNPTQGVGDRVLAKLAAEQPLFSPAWEVWAKNRREVPLAGTWTVSGHEIGRGDLVGSAEIKRVDADEYEVVWNLAFTDGTQQTRTGKGLLYAGYSWRGRSQEATPGSPTWREVLLLDEHWQTLKGRLFNGHYDEIGVDVALQRNLGRPRVLALGNAAIEVPAKGHRLDVHGEAFPPTVAAADFFVGDGLAVTAIERRSERHVVLTVDAASGTELGPRSVAFRSEPGSANVMLYDTVDYIRIRPLQGLSRIGGTKNPKQIERFEAYAMHRGKDEKPFTPDDVDLFQVRPRWALAEFKVRENDDDLQYVGSIDPVTAVFTPNVDGPNPARKWQANNVGDVFVTAEITLDVPVRPEPKKPAVDEKKDDKKTEPAKPEPGQAGESTPPTAPAKPVEVAKTPPPTPPISPTPPAGPPAREQKLFQARGHLIVTVGLYVRWNALEWEDR